MHKRKPRAIARAVTTPDAQGDPFAVSVHKQILGQHEHGPENAPRNLREILVTWKQFYRPTTPRTHPVVQRPLMIAPFRCCSDAIRLPEEPQRCVRTLQQLPVTVMRLFCTSRVRPACVGDGWHVREADLAAND